jgi:hypothetical protein
MSTDSLTVELGDYFYRYHSKSQRDFIEARVRAHYWIVRLWKEDVASAHLKYVLTCMFNVLGTDNSLQANWMARGERRRVIGWPRYGRIQAERWWSLLHPSCLPDGRRVSR